MVVLVVYTCFSYCTCFTGFSSRTCLSSCACICYIIVVVVTFQDKVDHTVRMFSSGTYQRKQSNTTHTRLAKHSLEILSMHNLDWLDLSCLDWLDLS